MQPKDARILRRNLLAGLGTTAAAATFLRPIMAQSQTGVAPQRLLVIHRPCGSAMNAKNQPGAPSYWWPTSGASGGTDWVTAPGGLIDSFKALRNDMVVMKGVHCPRIDAWLGDKHGAGMLAMISPSPKSPDSGLAAWPVLPGRTAKEQADTNAKFFTATDRSIDQLLLATLPTLQGTKVPSASLTPDLISAQPPDNCLRVVSYSKDDPNALHPTPIYPEANPSTAFKNIFGKAMTGADPAALARAQAQNKSVIDFISADLTSLQPRLPKLAREKVDAHLTSVRALELKLQNQGTGRACNAPTIAHLSTDTKKADERYHQAALEGMALIKTAFQCDLTRVMTYTFGWGNSRIHFGNIIPNSSSTDKFDNVEEYHNTSHEGGNNPHAAQYYIDKYFCQVVAGLLNDMKNTPDGVSGGNLLDNTLVVFWNECSVGNTHSPDNMPVLLFGGKFLNLQGGRYFDFSGKNNGKGRYMSDFWVQLSKQWSTAPGVSGSGYTPLSAFGAPQWNTGDMAELFG